MTTSETNMLCRVKIGALQYDLDDSRKDINYVTHVIANNDETAKLLEELDIDILTFVDKVFDRYGTVHVLLEPTEKERDVTYFDASLVKIKWALMILGKEESMWNVRGCGKRVLATNSASRTYELVGIIEHFNVARITELFKGTRVSLEATDFDLTLIDADGNERYVDIDTEYSNCKYCDYDTITITHTQDMPLDIEDVEVVNSEPTEYVGTTLTFAIHAKHENVDVKILEIEQIICPHAVQGHGYYLVVCEDVDDD